jgi:lysozyme family protein
MSFPGHLELKDPKSPSVLTIPKGREHSMIPPRWEDGHLDGKTMKPMLTVYVF